MQKLSIILVIFVASSLNTFAQIKTIKESLYFQTGKSDLSEKHMLVLDSLIDIMLASKSYDATIKGYTDNVGSIAINKIISNFRALNVYNYIVDKGIEKKHIRYVGLSMSHPRGSNKTSKGRALNRRTDIEVLFQLMDTEIVYKNRNVFSNTTIKTNNSTSSTNSTSNVNNTTNTSTNSNTNTTPVVIEKTLEIGPDFLSGKFPISSNKTIKTSNCISIDLNENTFVTKSKEPVDFDFKDYTQNYDIVKKGLSTKSNNSNLMMLGAFSMNYTQEYEELNLNSNNPIKVFIPGEYDQDMKLYSNPNNWTLDTVNTMYYDIKRNGYVVVVKLMNSMFGVMKPFSETRRDVLVKIKGVDPEKIKPYAIMENNLIVSGKRVKGKLFTFPIPSDSAGFKIRAAYTDYSSKTPVNYFLSQDVKKLEPKSVITKDIKNKKYMKICTPSALKFVETKMDQSSMNDVPCGGTN